MLDIAIYIGCAIICLVLLSIIFAQEAQIKALKADNEDLIDAANQLNLARSTDANGTVKRGERGRFVSAKA